MPQIIGPLVRAMYIKEDAGSLLGADPAAPKKRIIPLQAEDTIKIDQPRTPSTIYDGTRDPKGSTKGMISPTGGIPISGEFRFIGAPTDDFYGHGAYSRVGTLHRWVGYDNSAGPGAFQFQREFLQSSTFHRTPGLRIGTFDMTQQMSGQWMYNLGTIMGKGTFLKTDVGGDVVDDGPFVGFNYFDGTLLKGGVDVGGQGKVTAFRSTETNNLSRQDAAFSGGLAAGINAGLSQGTGELALLYSTEDGDDYLDEALNDTIVELECIWFNKPISASPTMYYRKIFPAVLFGRGTVSAGGAAGKFLSQTFAIQLPTAGRAAEFISSVPGPYALNVGDVMRVKIDGGSVLTDIPLTDGPTQTAADVAADLNADSGFSAVAIASDFYGRLRMQSLSTASTSAVQIDSTIDPDVSNVLGLDQTARVLTPIAAQITEVFNDLAEDY